MLRKVGIISALMLTLPTLASAWTLTAKIGSGAGTITSDRVAGTVTRTAASTSPVIGYFKTATNLNADTTQVVTLGATAGYKLSSVILDGVQQPAAVVAGALSVPVGSPIKNHSLVAYYTAVSYNLTVTQPTGGKVHVQRYDAAGTKLIGSLSRTGFGTLKNGDKIKVTALPNSDYRVTSVAGDTGKTGLQGDVVSTDITCADANFSTTATFGLVSQVTARLAAVNLTAAVGDTVALDGTQTTANGAITYVYSVTGGTGATIAPNGSTATITFANAGTFAVKLTATSGGVSSESVQTFVVSAPGTSASSICISCHGQRNATVVNNYNNGSHSQTTYGVVSCNSCHTNVTAETGHQGAVSYTGCNSCHTPGSPYGIYAADGITGVAPHFQAGTATFGRATSAMNGLYTTASFIQPTAAVSSTCSDCHGHNNAINAGWAEGGHGSLTAVPWVSDAGHVWLEQGPAVSGTANHANGNVATALNGVNYKVSPQQTNCIRCHTTQGFIQYVDSNFTKIDKIRTAAGQPISDSSPLTCKACHTSPEGGLRTANFGTVGYQAFWGYSNNKIAKKKVVTAIQLGSNKNSDICMPCHSQRASGQLIKDIFATTGFKQYSAGTAIYPHAAQPAAVFYGKGGYEFSSAATYVDRANHQRIGNYGTTTGYKETGITQGACVACHMSSDNTHSLEITDASFVNTCYKCHPTSFIQADVDAKKAEFDAAVAALGNLLVKKGITQDGVNPLAERKAKDMSLGLKDNAIAEKNMGAWFNWYLFSTSDKGGYAHNPSYARRLIFDSIDYLDDSTMNGTAAGTIQAMGYNGNPLYNAAIDTTKAVSFTNDPGCLGCHLGSTDGVANGETIPAIQKAPHYNTTGALVPGQNFTQAQFIVAGTQCNYCHGIGHGGGSPSGTLIAEYAESAHGDINGMAWSDYDFKTKVGCVGCHTTTGFVKSFGTTFTAGVSNPAIDAWGTTGDTTKQVLACNACHSSTVWKTSIRTATGGVTVPMGVSGTTPSATMTFADVGESNVCIPCHASRENGASLLAGNPTNLTTKGFLNPHYLGAAATFYGKGGFQFYTSGVRYNTYGAAGKIGKNANWSHGKLGMDNYSGSGNNDLAGKSNNTGNKGQCVACHLGPINTHSFGAAEVANATMAGTTSKTTAGNTLTRTCYGCHKGDSTSAVPTIESFIEEEKEIWDRMYDFFSWQLAQYGINYTEAYPYFNNAFGATVGTTFGGAGVVDNNKTRGAAMNLKLLKAEKGAFVHNRKFGRALIADSIIYLQKGAVGDRTVVEAVQNNVIKFTDYSTARPTSYDGQVGPNISITQLKDYLTSAVAGGFVRK